MSETDQSSSETPSDNDSMESAAAEVEGGNRFLPLTEEEERRSFEDLKWAGRQLSNISFPYYRLRIFLSVDFAGSTQFKQANAEPTYTSRPTSEGDQKMLRHDWVRPLAQFFDAMENNIYQEWQVLQGEMAEAGIPDLEDLEFGDAPHLWKALGDEVVYTKKLTDPRQAVMCVEAFRRAVRAYRKDVLPRGLNLKCAAWLASFPFTNTEVVLGFRRPVKKMLTKQNSSDNYLLNHFLQPFLHRKKIEVTVPDPQVEAGDDGPPLSVDQMRGHDGSRKSELFEQMDYLGPQMDLGFRLADKATPKKMTISVDLAFLLTSRTIPPQCPLKFGFDGQMALKGIRSGAPYPMIWIEDERLPNLMVDYYDGRSEDLNLDELEAKLLDRGNRDFTQSDLRQYSAAFIQHAKETWIEMPYIFNEESGEFIFGRPDQEIVDSVTEWRAAFSNEVRALVKSKLRADHEDAEIDNDQKAANVGKIEQSLAAINENLSKAEDC